ncbi:DoxX family protein [Photobacterium aquae]|uniref:DoxX family protein n=1 Tax=Photobacterium aquae TaxID=1195763 RepID=UPI00069FEEA1|nr:DoxX family protein [Photobacterium aquae]
MDRFLAFLSGRNNAHRLDDILLLLLRLATGGAMLAHGIGKIFQFGDLAPTFADPLGIGTSASLVIVILIEIMASLAILAGMLTRLFALILLLTMTVATYTTSTTTGWTSAEPMFLYAMLYLTLLIQGGGRLSASHYWLAKRSKTKPALQTA